MREYNPDYTIDVYGNKYYKTLKLANEVRQAEWDDKSQIDIAYRGNEMAGEVGEALDEAVGLLMLSIAAGRANNLIKKIRREQLGIRGSRATKESLAAELADIVICAGLVAMDQGIDLDHSVAVKFNDTTRKVGLTTFLLVRGDSGSYHMPTDYLKTDEGAASGG